MLKAYARQLFVIDGDDLNVYRVAKFLADCRALRDLRYVNFDATYVDVNNCSKLFMFQHSIVALAPCHYL
jgi:hypothetical protein